MAGTPIAQRFVGRRRGCFRNRAHVPNTSVMTSADMVDHAWSGVATSPHDAGAEVLRSACIVVVDDHAANVALLERVIRAAGAREVHAVGDAREAVRRCLDVGADLVLLDLQMPHVDGFAVMSALRAALPRDAFVPVLVVTADTTTGARDRALSAGAHDFLTKPFDHTEVVLRIRNLLQTRALYATVQRHNAALQADLDRRAEQERRVAEEARVRRGRIEDAVAGDGLEMVFQPIAALETGEVAGVEALARFRLEPQRPPNEWFEEALGVGLGTELELAAVVAALAQLHRLPAESFLSVNVSPAAAAAPELAAVLAGVPARRIVLELTEHTRIDDYAALLAALEPLRARGVRIAVDDAGAGYAGLQHVLRLRPDILKLDTDLTRGIDVDPARRALAAALVSFARELGAVIIAEGVETQSELDALRRLEVPWGQGYHLARPAPLQPERRRLDVRDGARRRA